MKYETNKTGVKCAQFHLFQMMNYGVRSLVTTASSHPGNRYTGFDFLHPSNVNVDCLLSTGKKTA